MRVISSSYEETVSIGRRLGGCLRGGEVIELSGDLGSGKTALTTGIAKGMGSQDNVASPTFTISKVYIGPRLTLHHFDFYRLPEPGLMIEQINEVMQDDKTVTVIEWAEIVKDVLPENCVRVEISRDEHDSDKRSFDLQIPKKYEYLLEDL